MMKRIMMWAGRILPARVFAGLVGLAWSLRGFGLRILAVVARVVAPRLPGTALRWGPPRGVAGLPESQWRFPDWVPEPFEEVEALTDEGGESLYVRADRPVYPEDLLCVRVDGGTVDGATGAVMDRDSGLVAEVSHYLKRSVARAPWDHPVFNSWRGVRGVELEGEWAVLTSPVAGVYFHWLLEVFPRLAVVDRARGGLAGLKFLTPPLSGFHRDCLRAAGIGEERCVEVERGCRYRVERLWACGNFAAQGMPRWLAPWLREQVLGKDEGGGDMSRIPWLYIYRKAGHLRAVENEQALIDLVESMGGVALALEGLAVEDQAALFYRADGIIAAHGSALANLVFCRPGTKVIELFAPSFTPLLYSRMGIRMGLDYRYLIGRGSHGVKGVPGLYAPISIEVERLEAALSRASRATRGW